MRLTEKQKNCIIENFKQIFKFVSAQLWLFGSRVNDNARGGDIDLLINCYSLPLNKLHQLEIQYHSLLQKEIGPRKIDIVLDYDKKLSNRNIIVNAKESGIILTTTREIEMIDEHQKIMQRINSLILVVNHNLDILHQNEEILKTLKLLPITEHNLINLDNRDRAVLDSVIYRFAILQDILGGKVFPIFANLITENITNLTRFDILALMEKHLVITNENDWHVLRNLRNKIAHEYDEEPDLRAQDINDILNGLKLLYKQCQLVIQYCNKLQIK